MFILVLTSFKHFRRHTAIRRLTYWQPVIALRPAVERAVSLYPAFRRTVITTEVVASSFLYQVSAPLGTAWRCHRACAGLLDLLCHCADRRVTTLHRAPRTAADVRCVLHGQSTVIAIHCPQYYKLTTTTYVGGHIAGDGQTEQSRVGAVTQRGNFLLDYGSLR